MNSELIGQLKILGQSTREKERIVRYELTKTKEDFFPKPQAKELNWEKKPEKKALITTVISIVVLFVIWFALTLSAVSDYINVSRFYDVSENPGEEYESWLDSFGDVEYFYELEEGWASVEASWKERGVNVDWEYVLEALDSLKGSITSSNFDDHLKSCIQNDGDDFFGVAAPKTFFALVLIIPIIILAVKLKKQFKKLREETKKYNEIVAENAPLRKYNEEELPKLISEWEEKCPEMYEKYEEHIKSLKAKVTELEEIISTYGHLLSESYHYRANDIALLIESGQAGSIEGAIRILDEKSQRRYAARERCLSCAKSGLCSWSVKEGFKETGDVCPVFVPKR